MNTCIIGSDNDVMPIQHQTITWTTADWLSVKTSEIQINENQWNLNQNTENTFQNVSNMLVILF